MDHVLKNLDDLKYNELQKIAKSVGIKANVKIDKLQKALREYYSEQTGDEKSKDKSKQDASGSNSSMESDENSSDDKKESKKVTKRVTKKAKRRGGRRKAAARDDEEEEMEEEDTQTSAVPRKETDIKSSTKSTPIIIKAVTPHRVGKSQSTPMTPQMKAVMNLKQTKTPMSQKRKRSGSLPKPVTGGSKQSTPVAEPSNKKLRRSTFEKSENAKLPTPNISKTPSPGVKEMIGAMKSDMSSAERKATLLKVLDEKVKKAKGTESPNTTDEKTQPTQIPRFAAFLAKKKEAQKKPITPGNKDWTKVHQKEFDKFDSIDVYLQKKRQRTKSVNNSVTKVTQIIDESRKAISSLKNHDTPNNENKPSPKVTQQTNKSNLFKSPSGPTPFKPTVFKTKNINTNFSGKTPVASITKTTPANQGPVKKATPKAGNTVEKKVDRKSLGPVSAKKFNGVTPFKFTATLNTTMPDMKSAKKPVFDLKASLARPITWKTHKGKLKPVGEVSHSGPGVKTPKAISRVDRRAAIANHRADRKHQSQMQRRGLKA